MCFCWDPMVVHFSSSKPALRCRLCCRNGVTWNCHLDWLQKLCPQKLTWLAGKITRLPDRSFPLSCLFSGVVNPEIASNKQGNGAMLINFESKSNPPKLWQFCDQVITKICGKAVGKLLEITWQTWRKLVPPVLTSPKISLGLKWSKKSSWWSATERAGFEWVEDRLKHGINIFQQMQSNSSSTSGLSLQMVWMMFLAM